MKTDCCCPTPTNPAACGCCEGVEALTPLPTVNRPGLSALSYRIGTHATFLETMKARLSSLCLGTEDDCKQGKGPYPLKKLTSREANDPAIALLDAWATVADVLTFYQERIANEGYLRTATERRSVLELGRLVGYQLRPGVASSVYLAYTLDDNVKEETIVPKGARSQSVPGPGELPQSFETSDDLKARAKWNNLKPRMTQPQTPLGIQAGDGTNQQLYLKGIATNLKPGDPLLIDYSDHPNPQLHWIKDISPEPASNRTRVVLTDEVSYWRTTAFTWLSANEQATPDLIGSLVEPPTPQYANSQRLPRDLSKQFARSSQGSQMAISGLGVTKTDALRSTSATAGIPPANTVLDTIASGDASHGVLKAFAPVLRGTLPTAVANAKVTPDSEIKVYALRVKAAPFGHNAPLRPVRLNPETKVMEYSEWAIDNPDNTSGPPSASFSATPRSGPSPLTVTFDNQSSGIIEKVSWYIDGALLTGEWIPPTHTFTDVKTYTVKLIVSDPAGNSSQYSLDIVVTQPRPPIG